MTHSSEAVRRRAEVIREALAGINQPRQVAVPEPEPQESHSPLEVRLEYPRSDDRPKTVKVTLEDVRAADSLIIGYDFDRDGWTIAREDEPGEVAFVPAWSDSEVWPS